VLERAGYRILDASNGMEALEIWEKNEDAIDLLLTDIVMPEGVSGRDLAGRLQARNPRLRVIFISGYSADVAGRELSLQEGQNFIQKPFSPQRLLETVRQSLDH
jgi:DNA-binding NtrC family response regulator